MIRLLLTALLAVSIGESADAPKKIELMDIVRITKDELRLSDVSTFNGFSEAEKKDLESVVLLKGLVEGKDRVLHRVDLAKILRNQIKQIELQANQHVALSIPETVTIQRIANNSTEAIKQYLLDKLEKQSEGFQFELRGFQVNRAKDLPEDHTWELAVDQKIYRGPSNFRIDFFKDGQKVHQGWVTADVRVFTDVPTATKTLDLAHRISEDDFKLQKQDVTLKSDIALARFLVGSKTKRGIREGSIIFNSDYEPEKSVSRGETVDLLVAANTWKVTIRGQMLDSGRVGDTVRVLNTASKKILTGTVVAKGLVQVQ